MTGPERPDLSFFTNQRWAIKMALLLIALTLPADYLQLKGETDWAFAATMMAMTFYFVILFRSLARLAGVRGTINLAQSGIPYPFTLLLGLGAWAIFLSILVNTVMISIMEIPSV